LGLAESKDDVDKLLNDRELALSNDRFENISIESSFKNIFDFEIEGKEEMDYGSRVSYGVLAVPDDAIQEALNWYENQSDEIKAKIDLIGKWNNPWFGPIG